MQKFCDKFEEFILKYFNEFYINILSRSNVVVVCQGLITKDVKGK
jgi:hypothetical protein